MEKSQDFAGGVVDKGLEQAMAFLENEENQHIALEVGKNIAFNVLQNAANVAMNNALNPINPHF